MSDEQIRFASTATRRAYASAPAKVRRRFDRDIATFAAGDTVREASRLVAIPSGGGRQRVTELRAAVGRNPWRCAVARSGAGVVVLHVWAKKDEAIRHADVRRVRDALVTACGE